MIPLSNLASEVKPSATLAAGAKAKEMRAQGVEVFDFSLGEPDFNTPAHICEAAFRAVREGATRYTAAAGTPGLRQAIARTYHKVYGLEVAAQQVVVSNGAKHALYTALAALCGPGDEVIIPSPYWVSYSDLVQMTGARTVLVPTALENQFKMTPEQLRAALTPRSKVLMLNSPSNPTGVVYSRPELEKLADAVLETRLAVISDEIYERLVFGAHRATCFVTLRPELAQRTITISGVSKTYAMTGWRIGWSIAPVPVANAMGAIQSQQTGCPCSVSQAAAQAALEGDQRCVEEMRREFEARGELVYSRLQGMGLRLPVPAGAFYAFFDVSMHFGRKLAGTVVNDSATFCRTALERAHLNLVPGSAFGAEGFVRMSFAASRQELSGGLNRLEQFLAG